MVPGGTRSCRAQAHVWGCNSHVVEDGLGLDVEQPPDQPQTPPQRDLGRPRPARSHSAWSERMRFVRVARQAG